MFVVEVKAISIVKKKTRFIIKYSWVVLHLSMLEPEKCPSEVNFWCSSMLDFLMLDANEPLKIGKFWQK